jgi:condensin complex subunit 3
LDIPATYWQSLTPESVVLARIFVDHCTNTKNEPRLESALLPVVTAYAFHVQEAYNGLLLALEEVETARELTGTVEGVEENEELEEELAKKEVVMSELLRLALSLDYGDEIGRRKVFSVVSE